MLVKSCSPTFQICLEFNSLGKYILDLLTKLLRLKKIITALHSYDFTFNITIDNPLPLSHLSENSRRPASSPFLYYVVFAGLGTPRNSHTVE